MVAIVERRQALEGALVTVPQVARDARAVGPAELLGEALPAAGDEPARDPDAEIAFLVDEVIHLAEADNVGRGELWLKDGERRGRCPCAVERIGQRDRVAG